MNVDEFFSKRKKVEINVPEFSEEELNQDLLEIRLINNETLDIEKKIKIKRGDIVSAIKIGNKFTKMLPMLGIKGFDVIALLSACLPKSDYIKIDIYMSKNEIEEIAKTLENW